MCAKPRLIHINPIRVWWVNVKSRCSDSGCPSTTSTIHLCMGNQILEQVSEVSILGVKFDIQRSFRPHIMTTKVKVDQIAGAMKAPLEPNGAVGKQPSAKSAKRSSNQCHSTDVKHICNSHQQQTRNHKRSQGHNGLPRRHAHGSTHGGSANP